MISIVTTLYKSAPYIVEFYERAVQAVKGVSDDYEIIFVNDGSPDDSLNIALSLIERDKNVRLIDLSRNFGHFQAILTGLEHVKGDLIWLLDVDLEEDPEWLESFLTEMREKQADVVFGVQESRKGKWFERVSGAIFWWLFNALSATKIPPNNITARVMTRQYVDALLQYKEHEIFIDGLLTSVGFRQVEMRVKKHSRPITSYSFFRRIRVAVDGITSFSDRPLILVFFLGLFMTFISLIASILLVMKWYTTGDTLEGWTSTMVSIWLVGGLGLICTGILAIYISKLFLEVKGRPRSIIRKIYG